MIIEHCKYFGKCGGCQIINLSDAEYIADKLNNLKSTLEHNQIEYKKLNDIISFPTGIRRRASLKVDYGCNIGFYKPLSNDLVVITNCPLLCEEINALIPYLRPFMKSFVKRSEGSIIITNVENGITIHFENINLTLLDTPKIKDFAIKHNVIRVSSQKEVLYESENPYVILGGIKVPYPLDTFLQPSIESQEAIIDTVAKFMGGNSYNHIGDLFSGLGLFSFNFIKNAKQITAFDCDTSAIKQINIIANSHHLNIKAKAIDLFKKPIKIDTLNTFDLVILDPPRDGAKSQTEQISKSNIKNIIYVSCNPHTFASNVKVLLQNGYKIEEIQPIDQFPNTKHLELVAKIVKV